MSLSIGVVMDPIEGINPKKDTTLGLLNAAQRRGHSIFYMQPKDLWLEDDLCFGAMRAVSVSLQSKNWYSLSKPVSQPLIVLDAILMRRDPPFDLEYLYTTYLLETAERRGTAIINRCSSLRNCNEKLFATEFPECCPPLLVSQDITMLQNFQKCHNDVVYKPLDGMGGSSVFRVQPSDPNLKVILETLTHHGTQTIMAQRFIPEITDGDKRVLMIDGQPVPMCLARIPPVGETRGNLAAGGIGQIRPLSERDRWIAAQVGPRLKKLGLSFVGLDIIGNYLTEINITSPTCMREIEDQTELQIGQKVIETIEKYCACQND